MLILPPGHAQTIGRRSLTRRERWMIGAVLGVVAALAIALIISIATAGRSSAHGCIHLTIPGAVGAEEIDQCGEQARATCASTSTRGAFSPESARAVAEACRKAGLPTAR